MASILRSKGNQTKKCGQLVDYKMRDNFLEKSYSKCGGETSPRHFCKIRLDHISGSIVWSFIQFVFIVCQAEGYWNILKLSHRPFAFTSSQAIS